MEAEQCSSIQVIGAGLGRTGTLSLRVALETLGYKTYHFVHPSHAATWAAYSRGLADSDDILDLIVDSGFTATCDQPTADLYVEQLRRYPGAKVILTVRDSGDRWATSWKTLMDFIEVQERPFSLSYPTFIQWIPFMQHWKEMRSIMGTHIGLPPGELIRGWRSKPDGWLAEQYEMHNARVMETVPSSQLLVFNVKEGWAPLCDFLEKNIPNEPFPFVNESSDIEFAWKTMIVLSYAWIPAAISAVALMWNFLRRSR
uniref:P-loop containing nucleoside triphosphate hydrolase protein n=1 Tax=Trieres chinensis TaxID=1514140 RepID=A0A7S2A9X9_TRICV|mmetsp:Transcript_7963/g.16872  ORF Transcript_7963/g.16872 Transcript_7963/m.16872 type:complete len:257 (+) Transcript_7963:91-861(+)